jgi:hypothetical protein
MCVFVFCHIINNILIKTQQTANFSRSPSLCISKGNGYLVCRKHFFRFHVVHKIDILITSHMPKRVAVYGL